MVSRLTPHFISLVYEGTLKSFWRKEALKRFLRECSLPDQLIQDLGHEETKRNYLDRLFELLRTHALREQVFARMARSLIDQQSFPDLEGWEDSPAKKAEARRAIQELREYVEEQDQEITDLGAKKAARQMADELREKNKRSQLDLEKLSSRINLLYAELGTQQGGYKFQDWFYDLMEYFDVVVRRPYSHDGRQIDGSITLKDTTYLVELKFTSDQASATDIDSFIRKVTTKADNTMGVFVSMSGYSSVALKEACRERTPILLLDHNHIYFVLGGGMKFPAVVDRLKRHASQTGHGYLLPSAFGE